MKRIIYPNSSGGVAVLIPSGELAIEEVARKDVPAGVPYKIVNTSDIPDDRTFRNAWEVDMTSSDGVGIGAEAWFAEVERARLIEETAAKHKAELAAQVTTIQEALND